MAPSAASAARHNASASASASSASAGKPAGALAATTSALLTSTPATKKTVRFHAAGERRGSSGSNGSGVGGGAGSGAGAGAGNGFGGSNGGAGFGTADGDAAGALHPDDEPPAHRRRSAVVRPTLLQPRVAVVLGVARLWHLPLFLCRLLSVAPAIWWGLGILLRLLVQLHALALALARAGFGEAGLYGGGGGGSGGMSGGSNSLSLDSRLKLTETALAMIWCAASAYLSFFFTDCLMSRWLLHYTPQATIVRLLAINALHGYLTSWVTHLAGASSGGDARLLLPAWVAIAAILTGLYHVTQRKINIRKETSISISVFSFASFISMVSLLAQLYWDRPEYADVPVVAITRRVCAETARVVAHLFDIGNMTMDL